MCDRYRQQGLRVVQLVYLLFQSHTGGGLGQVVVRADGNGTYTQDDAQTQNELDGAGIELMRRLTLSFAIFVVFHNVKILGNHTDIGQRLKEKGSNCGFLRVNWIL
jgi:hypothetical protein